MKTTITQTVIAAIALVAVSPALTKPHKPAVKHAAAKSAKTAKAAKPVIVATAMQAIAPPPPEGPADLPAAAADAPAPGDAPGTGAGAARRPVPAAAVVGPVSAAQAACAGSQGQNVAIPDGYGSQTTRCGVNASLGRVDARVDYRVKPISPH